MVLLKHVAYLLHVDAVACAAEDETGFHGFGKAACLDDIIGQHRLGKS